MSFIDQVGVKKGNAANKRYKKVATKNSVAKNSYNYLAPIPPAQLQKLTAAQIRAQINPYLAQINKQFATQQKQGIADISAANKGFVTGAEQYPGMVGAADTEMIHGQQLLDQGIRQFLSETGQNVTQGVMGQQQGAGAPVEALAATQAQTGGLGTGITTNAVGQGASTLSRMLTQQAADKNYGNLLPNVARAAGTENVNLFTRNIANQRSQALGDVTQQIPGLVATTYQNLLKNEVDKATATRAFNLDKSAQDASIAAGPDKHYQQKIRHNKDGTITYGSYDPSTGQTYWDESSTIAQPPGGAGGGPKFGVNDPGYKDAVKTAAKIHENMMKKLNGYQAAGPGGLVQIKGMASSTAQDKAKIAAVVLAARNNAVSQAYAAVDAAHPEYSQKQKISATQKALRQAGFPRGAEALPAYVMGPGTGGKAKTQPGGPVKVAAPQGPTAPNPVTEKDMQAQKNKKEAQLRTQKAKAMQGTVKHAQSWADTAAASKGGRGAQQQFLANPQAFLIQHIHVGWPEIPMKDVRRIARDAIYKYPVGQ